MDYVGRAGVTEGLEVFHNPAQVWYFVDHQLPDEVIMFCNTNSQSLEIPCNPPPSPPLPSPSSPSFPP